VTRASLLLVAVGATVLASGATAQSPVPGIAIRTLRPGVHLLSGHANGNMLAVEGGNGLLLVDAQSADRVADADAALRGVTAAPVRVVVNTHYHEDHIGGNPHWVAAGARVIAQCRVAVQAGKDTTITEFGDWHRTPAPAAALATQCVQDTLALAQGDVPVRLLHLPAAHTDGDLLVHLPSHNVLHVGDVMEIGSPPFIDWWAGGTVDGMLAACDRALAMADERTIIVPGHGEPTDREGLRAYRDMLRDISTRVAAAEPRTSSLDAVLATDPTAGYVQPLGGPRKSSQFVRLLYLGARR
jgi:glyoxylase-like metal-dependent hydrolase (beta-lactamase superfamily II)